MKYSLLTVWLLGLSAISGHAASGDVDLSFDAGSGVDGPVYTMALQSDGKLVVGGDFSTVKGAVRSHTARLNVDGSVDSSFDPGAGANATVSSVAVHTNGQVLIAGSFTSVNGITRNYVARLKADGSVDPSFDPGTGPNSTVTCVAVQADGKVLIGGLFASVEGTNHNGIARLNADGTLDASFDPGTGLSSSQLPQHYQVNSIVVQPDSKVLIGGAFSAINGVNRFYVARLNANGSLDMDFNPDTVYPGFSVLTVASMALQGDGKILLAGSFPVTSGIRTIARLNSNGTLDSGFNPTTGFNAAVNALALQPDGNILIGGQFTSVNGTNRNCVARLSTGGVLDTGFVPAAPVSGTVYVNALALQTDGQVILGGDYSDPVVTGRNRIERLSAAGALAPSFNSSSAANAEVHALALDLAGNVLIGGEFTTVNSANLNHIARLNPNGGLDGTFNPGTGANNIVFAVAAQSNGQVLIGGAFTQVNSTNFGRIARLNASGGLDYGFHTTNGANSDVYAILVQPDGAILIGGAFTAVNRTNCGHIARLTSDGSIDASFNPGTGTGAVFNPWVYALALQTNGQILVGGSFTSVNGTNRSRIARLNSNGSLDPGFDPPGAILDLDVYALAVQPDGKALVGGAFQSEPGRHIARLNNDGTVDTNFNVGSGPNGIVYSVALQGDGKVLIGGTFNQVNGTNCNRIARLNPDGTLDTTFSPNANAEANNEIRSVLLQPDGRILLGGDFSLVDHEARWRVARLLAVPTRARLTIEKVASNAVLHWLEPGYSLQSAPLVTGTYTNIDGATSPYTNPITGDQKYFRLKAD